MATKPFVAICVVLFVVIGGAKTASAASLYFSPSSGSYAIGSPVAVSVYVSSADQAMNAASGIITFPSDKLQVTSLSKTGSIFGLWVQEPSFSNSAGTVSFEGIVLNPGFTGAVGKILTINFKVKGAGLAPLNFSSGSALANDGKGTAILQGLGNAAFEIQDTASGGRTAARPPERGAPAAPLITSSTHPDPNKWYAKKDASFSWPVPLGVTAARILVSKSSQAIPSIVYAPPITAKDIADIRDGVWYFAAQLRNAAGWGAIAHFKFQIDTAPPEPFSIAFVGGKGSDNPRPSILFETTDTPSGIDGYRVKIGDGDFFTTMGAGSDHPLTLPVQAPGKKVILVQAVDKAGNVASASEELTIAPIGLPLITEYPQRLMIGDVLKVKGTAPAHSTVIIFLQRSPEEMKNQTVQSDEAGTFTLIWSERMEEGLYRIWARAQDARGATSGDTEKLTISAEQSLFVRWMGRLINYLSLATLFVAILLLLLLVIGYSWYRLYILRRRIRTEVRKAESALHKAFDLLKEDVREQIKMLEKTRSRRDLTAEEEKVIQRLKKNIEAAEKFVKKEIDDIAREVS